MKSTSTTTFAPKPEEKKPVADEVVVGQLQAFVARAEDLIKLQTLKREKYDEREALTRTLSDACAQGGLIGNYESLLSEADRRALGPTLRDAVIAIYGKKRC